MTVDKLAIEASPWVEEESSVLLPSTPPLSSTLRPPLNSRVVLALPSRPPLETWVVQHDARNAARFRLRASGAPGPEFDSATFARLKATWRPAHVLVGAPVQIYVGGEWLAAKVCELLLPEPRVRVRLVGEAEEFDSAAFETMGISVVFEETSAQRCAGEGGGRGGDGVSSGCDGGEERVGKFKDGLLGRGKAKRKEKKFARIKSGNAEAT